MTGYGDGGYGDGLYGGAAEVLQEISREPLYLVDIQLSYCSRTFGSSPCLPPAGTTLCYNTHTTCRFLSAYDATLKSYKFSLKGGGNPLPGETCRPYLQAIKWRSQEVRPAEALLINQSVSLTFCDEPDNDIGIDKYRASPVLRQSGSFSDAKTATGTFWRKLRARNKNYKNRRVTISRGFEGTSLDTMFTGVIENWEIDNSGNTTLTIRGLLQLTDTDYPKKTDGKLFTAMTTGDTTLTMIDTTDMTQYSASGYVKIDTEIIGYSGVSGYTLTGLTRGQFTADGWSTAATHAVDAMIQQTVVYNNVNPIDIINDVLNQAGIADTDIDTALFDSVKDDWFDTDLFRAIIHEPVKAKELLQELRDQTFTFLWQGDDNLIKIGFMAPYDPGTTYPVIRDTGNIIYGSRSVNDRQDLRVTKAAVYYNVLADKTSSSPEDYELMVQYWDIDAESAIEYGEQKDSKAIFSRWIKSDLSGYAYTSTLAARIVNRFRDGWRNITFDLEIKDSGLAVGDLFKLETRDVLNFDGEPEENHIYMVIKKEQKTDGRLTYTAFDTQLHFRYAWIPDETVADDYDSATDADKLYAYVSEENEKMADGDSAYYII